MKKLLSTMLCMGLLSINLTGLATETAQVKIDCTNVPLKSALQSKYSAYRVDYINEGQNPVRVNDVKCYNRVAVADVYSSYKIKTPSVGEFFLGLVTLGLTTIPSNIASIKESGKILDAQNEARRFNAFDLTATESINLKTSNEILGQGQNAQFNILVPLNETPEVVGTFEELVSHKYIRVQSK